MTDAGACPDCPDCPDCPGDRRLPALCRPSGWVCLWRRIGAMSVLDCAGATRRA